MPFRFLKHAVVPFFAFGAAIAGSAAVAQMERSNVSPNLQISKDLGQVSSAEQVTVSVQVKRANQEAFEQALDALYDPGSPTFHKWMTDADLQKYAPSQAHIDAVRKELERNGLTILSVDPSGLVIRATGPAANMQTAFQTPLRQYEHNGQVFRANVQQARLTGEAGDYVAGVSGLESHKVHPMLKQAINPATGKPYPPLAVSHLLTPGGLASLVTDQCLGAPTTFTLQDAGTTSPVGVYHGNVYDPDLTKPCDFLPTQLQLIYGLDQAYAKGLNGRGQTIVLVEAFGYPTMIEDANAFNSLTGLPPLTASNFSVVYPEGKPSNPNLGILTGWNEEIALDIQWSHAMAPGAKIVVVASSGQDNEDFQTSLLYVANHNLGNSVSNSWEADLDLLSGPLEQQSFENVLAVAAAKGISVNFSAGDSGDGGVGSPVGAAGVPSDAPHATAIGGTAILNNVGTTGFQQLGWGNYLAAPLYGRVQDPPYQVGFFGGSGGGESTYFAKPAWQKSLPGTGRQTPDVSALADPFTGVPIVVTSNGSQYLDAGIGGTSLACPIFSAIWAIANQRANHPLGQAAPAIAGLTSGILTDVLPTTPSSATNVSGIIFDASGSTYYSPAAMFGGNLGAQGSLGFTSAFYGNGVVLLYDLSFGTDTSLTVTPGWDNVTGYGTPIGLQFINAVANYHQ